MKELQLQNKNVAKFNLAYQHSHTITNYLISQ